LQSAVRDVFHRLKAGLAPPGPDGEKAEGRRKKARRFGAASGRQEGNPLPAGAGDGSARTGRIRRPERRRYRAAEAGRLSLSSVGGPKIRPAAFGATRNLKGRRRRTGFFRRDGGSWRPPGRGSGTCRDLRQSAGGFFFWRIYSMVTFDSEKKFVIAKEEAPRALE